MSNPFENRSMPINGPATDYLPVTPSDSEDLPEVAISLYAATGGAVAFTSVRGTTRTVTVGDGGWIICGVRRVLATGTTATGIHALVI